MRRNVKFTIYFIVFCMLPGFILSAEKIELSREFNLFTSQNLKGYLTPFFTSVEESINSNMFTTANYFDCWSAGLDISVAGMFIPNSQTTYNAERPDEFGNKSISRTAEIRGGETVLDNMEQNFQPTVYGGHSVGIFSSPQYHKYPDSIYKSVGYVEGNDISFMSGIPSLQLRLGLPTRTELRFRFLTVNVADAPLVYWGVTLAQRIDQYFNIFQAEDRIGLAVHAGFSAINRNPGVTATSWVIGSHISKSWDFGVSIYAGLQVEGITGKFEATRIKLNPNDPNYIKDSLYYRYSPWPEIRAMKDLSIDIESYNSFKIVAGIDYSVGIVALHADAGYASQPIVSAGISFTFGQWGNSKDLERELQLKRQKKLNK